MADRRARDALLRLRRVAELEAQRNLGRARGELDRARAASEHAKARAAAADLAVTEASARPATGAAGRLAIRERFLERLRSASKDARKRAAAAARAAADAESALHDAQEKMQSALRAREGSEAHEAALAVTAERQRTRREESAQHDRFRRTDGRRLRDKGRRKDD